IGSQYFWVVPGDLEAARATTQGWYDAVGLKIPHDTPAWVKDLILYQASAGGSVDSRFSDVGGFRNFAKQLDYIADLGCNGFWLMSVLAHKDPKSPATGWNLYDPYDYHLVDPAYGGEKDLTFLVQEMRRRRFRLFNEIVPSGGRAPITVDHTNWWTYGQDGKRSLSFAQSLDYSNPDWQRVIRDSIHYLSSHWKFDGYRVDVADGYGANWNKAGTSHKSLSTMGGALGMLKAIREGGAAAGCPPVILPETIDNRPEMARWGALGYGFRFIFFLEDLHPSSLEPEELRQKLTEFFDNERGSLPRGMISLRALNNHDTVVSYGRADRRFGVGLQRALTGVCTVVEGVPMIYQEQEVGSYSYFRRLFWARRRTPEMNRGSADYTGVTVSPGVFPVLRSLGKSHALGLVNLSSDPVNTEVTLPEGVLPRQGCSIYDTVSGRTRKLGGDSAFRWPLAGYETAILRVGNPPSGRVPPETSPAGRTANDGSKTGATLKYSLDAQKHLLTAEVAGLKLHFDPGAGEVNYTPSEGGVRVSLTASRETAGKDHPVLRIYGADRWWANTVKGVYEDRVLRRHYPWPNGLYSWNPSIVWGYEPYNLYRAVLPCGRLWQSAVAPLAVPGTDGHLPQFAFADSKGHVVVLDGLTSTAHNLVLTDRSEEPSLKPSGLSLIFCGRDEQLNPNWLPGYRRGQGWVEIPNPQAADLDKPLRVEFVLRQAASTEEIPVWNEGVILSSSASPRLTHTKLSFGPGERHLSWERHWLVTPNEVRWTGLTASNTATYDLWIQLRHSEVGPEGRDLCEHYRLWIDSEEVLPAWPRLNVWHTGNGYFGWAKVSGLRLKAGEHSLRLATTHTWCALSPTMYLSRQPEFSP
ncbi:MAG: hypothetical protein HY318_06065, partial [Armatimonadetes bacterium]|nr:hypothetical protein [Armatimonadota bacterium]